MCGVVICHTHCLKIKTIKKYTYGDITPKPRKVAGSYSAQSQWALPNFRWGPSILTNTSVEVRPMPRRNVTMLEKRGRKERQGTFRVLFVWAGDGMVLSGLGLNLKGVRRPRKRQVLTCSRPST